MKIDQFKSWVKKVGHQKDCKALGDNDPCICGYDKLFEDEDEDECPVKLVRRYSDNGEFSHWELIDEWGQVLWSNGEDE